MRAWPTELVDVIWVTSAIWPRWRSRGAATLVATVSGPAPGSWAWTEMVGKSTWGSDETGSLKKAKMPASAMANVSSVVATGRLMKGAEMFIPPGSGVRLAAAQAPGEAVEHQVDDRGGEQGQHLADEQAADDGDAEGPAQFGAGAAAEHQGQRAEEGGHGGHQDRAEAEQAGLEDGFARRFALLAFGGEGEVDHHDGVLLHDADQQDDADDAR